MNEVFWLRENQLAGRSGPNLNEWNIAQFKLRGIAAVLSVNFAEEVNAKAILQQGMAYANIPMSPNAPVQAGDKALCLLNLPVAMQFIEQNIVNGQVLVHCRSGKDRTGLVLAAYLIYSEGISVSEAMYEVLRVRPIAFSAQGWMDFAEAVLTAFAKQHARQLA